jgi:acyl carrier protein
VTGLATVQRVLSNVPGVTYAAVRYEYSAARRGSVLAADLVLHRTTVGLVRQHLSRELPSELMPLLLREIATGDDTVATREPVRPTPDLSREQARAVRRLSTQELCDIVAELLHVSPVDEAMNFFDLGASSLDVVRLCSALEAMCGQRVDIGLIYESADLADITRHVVNDAT